MKPETPMTPFLEESGLLALLLAEIRIAGLSITLCGSANRAGE